MKKYRILIVIAIVLCFTTALCVGCNKEEEQDPPKDETIKTLDEFKTALAERDVVTLGANITLTEPVEITRKVTVELNGKEITSPSSVFSVRDGGELTVNGNGNVTAGKGGDYSAVTVRGANAKATLNGGNFTVGGDAEGLGNSCIYAAGGAKIYINGGKYSSAAKYNERYYVLNIENGSGSVIKVRGGSFVGQNPADGDDKDGGSFLADGYTATESNGTYTVTLAKKSGRVR